VPRGGWPSHPVFEHPRAGGSLARTALIRDEDIEVEGRAGVDSDQRFRQFLKRDLVPLVRADGFKGSGSTFWRVKDERIDIVNIQGSRYGGQSCVNLAVHYSFLPPMGGLDIGTDPRNFKEHDCVFRGRLREAGEDDHWWIHGTDEAEAQANVASVADTYKRRAHLFFARFEPFPDVFLRVTPEQLKAGDFSSMPAGQTEFYAILTMARIMHHIGRMDRCRAFAELGLSLPDREGDPELSQLARLA
jgi:hypothetical protein